MCYIYYTFLRLIDRLLLIPVLPREGRVKDPEQWNSSFQKLLGVASSVLGKIIELGQWIHSQDGIEFRKSCKAIVVEACGDTNEGSRMVKMWSCGLLVARKVW